MNGEVPPPTHFYPGISDELSDFVMKAIHKDRNQRFANAIEMLKELDRLESSGQTTVQGDGGFIQQIIQEKIKDPGLIPPFIPERSIGSGFNLSSIQEGSTDSVPDSIPVLSPELRSEQLTGNDMILVEGGSFMMGSNTGGPEEKPEHSVTVSSFRIGKVQVTQALWREIMGNNPSHFKCDNKPVEGVNWYNAVEFCNRLSRIEGLNECYREVEREKTGLIGSLFGQKTKVILCDFNANGYRLPTEAEWEYAARGGNNSLGYNYSGSEYLDEVGWYTINSTSETQEVGKKQPNELGIYDMSGNVWEWCWDWYSRSYYSSSSRTDPRGPEAGSSRVLRGGSWFNNAEYCRVSTRRRDDPDNSHVSYGFRLVRSR